MNLKTFLWAGTVCSLLLASCALPSGLLPPTPGRPQPTATLEVTLPAPTLTATFTNTSLPPTTTATPVPPTATSKPTETIVPSPTLSPTPITFPAITFNTNANCRLGPSVNYNQVTNFFTNRTTIAEGRNRDSSWLWVKAASENCWINVTTLKDPVDFSFLPVISFMPLPEAPSRLTVANLVCVGRIAVTLRWADVTGETGYMIFRDGIQLTKLKADATEYVDYPPLAAEYLYEIRSFNDVGISESYGQVVRGCKN